MAVRRHGASVRRHENCAYCVLFKSEQTILFIYFSRMSKQTYCGIPWALMRCTFLRVYGLEFRYTETPVRLALPRPVAHLLGHCQVLLVLLERLGKNLQILIRVTEGAVDNRSIARHASPCRLPCRTCKCAYAPAANTCVSALAACDRATPWTPVRDLPLVLPLRPWGIMACIHGCRNATSSAEHESGAMQSLTTSQNLLSTRQISLCRMRLFPKPSSGDLRCKPSLQQPLHMSIDVSSPRVQHPA